MTHYHYYESSQDKLGNCTRYPYGDFHQVHALNLPDIELFLIPGHFEGSDYSGGLANKSNHRSFLKQFGKVQGVYDLYGGFATYAIAIRKDVAENHQDIKECLDALENYGVMDDCDVTALEIEMQDEFMKDDLVPELRRKILFNGITPAAKILENLAWESLQDDGLGRKAPDWSFEGSGAWIDSTPIKHYVEDRIIIARAKVKSLPTYMAREWSCDATQLLFEQRLRGQNESGRPCSRGNP